MPDRELGSCPLCGRQMIEGKSVDRHHLVPNCRGGTETVHMHRVCHGKIHHTFTEKQLEQEFNTAEKLLKNDEIVKFVKWVQKKDPEFYDHNEDTAARKRRRKR
jgi:hypothetical protein